MSSGLRAIVAGSPDKPLDFVVSMYVGQMVLSGRPAPSDWFFKSTRDAAKRVAWESFSKVKDQDNRLSQYREKLRPVLAAVDSVSLDKAAECDELTLVDAYAFPAVGTSGTQSGGTWFPTLRVPYRAIDTWWIVDGRAIPARGGSGGGGGGGIGIAFGF